MSTQALATVVRVSIVASGPRVVVVPAGGREGLPPRMRWRLSASNHRPLLDGTRSYFDQPSCVRDIAAVVAAGADARPEVALSPEDGRWRWSVVVGAEVRARSVSAFDRRAECVRAASVGIVALRTARLPELG